MANKTRQKLIVVVYLLINPFRRVYLFDATDINLLQFSFVIRLVNCEHFELDTFPHINNQRTTKQIIFSY